jgi:hypothetical protein
LVAVAEVLAETLQWFDQQRVCQILEAVAVAALEIMMVLGAGTAAVLELLY